MRFVVTGGAGFIGSWLCESLLSKGHSVTAIDNLVTGREDNIEHLKESDSFSFLNQDVSKGLSIEEGVDCIFHLASPASPVDYQELPIETMMANSLGTLHALEMAREKGARFLLASTSEVYGDPKEHPQREEHWGNVNPVGPRSCYDESKRFAEALAMSFRRIHNLDVRIARIFNTYGPRMRRDDGRVIPNFITQATSGKPITVYGDGKQTRSFCYVDDMVRGLEALMLSDKASGEIFNLGNPDEHTILEIAEKVRELTGSSSELAFQDLPEDDPRKRRPDISKIKKMIFWSPEIKIETGIKNTINWFITE